MSVNKLKNLNSPRAVIIDLLVKCNQGSFSNEIVPLVLSKSDFSPSDKALITKVVYSTLRNQIRIDNALSKISSKKINQLDELALNALRSIICQLMEQFEMYAVVNETIKVLPFNLKGFVNAVSRKAIKLNESNQLFKDEKLSVKFSLPEWIVEEIENTFQTNTGNVLEALNYKGKVTLAPFRSTLPINEKYAVGKLLERSRVLDNGRSVAELQEIKNGQALVVDQSSQFIINQLDTKDRVVLDICCAPGGKSFLMAANAKKVVSTDISTSRLVKMAQTKERLNTNNVEILAADALNLPINNDKTFDIVFLDAPCSGLGVLKRRPDARNNIKEKIIDELSMLQKEMINVAAKFVGESGLYVYSVCTFTYRETEKIIKEFLTNHKEFEEYKQDPKCSYVEEREYGYLIHPTNENDSMYYCILRHKII